MHIIIGNKKLIGNKALGLIELDRYNLTPNFIAIDNSLSKSLYEGINLSDEIDKIRKKILNKKILENYLKKIYKAIKDLKIDDFMIRSSFLYEDSKTKSFADIFESVHVSHINELENAIKKVVVS